MFPLSAAVKIVLYDLMLHRAMQLTQVNGQYFHVGTFLQTLPEDPIFNLRRVSKGSGVSGNFSLVEPTSFHEQFEVHALKRRRRDRITAWLPQPRIGVNLTKASLPFQGRNSARSLKLTRMRGCGTQAIIRSHLRCSRDEGHQRVYPSWRMASGSARGTWGIAPSPEFLPSMD